jgi:CHAT domain-containing protein/outer membrane protein assembly factor BamD (BamD/ComL family)
MNLQNSKELSYEDGLKQYNDGNLNKAIGHYRKSIELACDQAPVDQLFVFEKSIELAQIYLESNQPQGVLSYASLAYKIYQSDTSGVLSANESADFLELLGNLTFYLEQFDKSSICYSGAESLYLDFNNRNLAKAKKLLSKARQGEILISIKEIQSIPGMDGLNIETKNKARKYLADIMVLTSQYQEALNTYQIIFNELKQNDKISTYWLLETLFNMATANFELGNYGIAMNQYKQVVSEIEHNKFPGSDRLKMQTLLMIAKISIFISDTKEAIRLLDSVDEHSLFEPDRIYFQLIRAQIELHDLNSDHGSSQHYLDLISGYRIGKITNDKETAILILQSNIHFRNGEIHSSIEILKNLICYYQNTRDVYQIIIYKLHLCQVLLFPGTDDQKSEILSHIEDVEALISNEAVEVFIIITQIQIAKLFCSLGEYSRSWKTLHLIFRHEWHLIRSYAISCDKEQVYFQDIINLLLNITLVTSDHLNEKKIELQEHYLNLYIRLKSLFIVNNGVFRGLIKKTDLPKTDLILRYYQKLKELNSRTFNKSDDYHKIKMEVNSLENIIKTDTDYFSSIRHIIDFEWRDISGKLEADEAAISFFRYERMKDTLSDQSGYSVFFILKYSKHPELIILDITDEFLKEVLPFNLLRNFESGGSFYLDVEIPILGNLAVLYERIFKPLEVALKGIQRIYFTVDGLLNYVPFGALMNEENRYLTDKFELIQLQNLRDIKGPEQAKVMDSIAIFGGIDFGTFYEEPDGKITGDDNSLSKVSQIPKATYENKEISELFRGKEYPKYMSDHLDLTTFRNTCMEKKPSCIHILTHGFFFNDEQKNYSFEDVYQYNTADIRSHSNPLLRSGIFTSDYNNFLSNTKVKTNEKGVITSYDISRLELEDIYLVTIHACESALGAVRSGETYGLARAFRIAGVKCVILTLWKIQYTGFYISFYSHLLENNGKNLRVAFDAAVNDIRKELPNPYWWSGFVLIE